MSSFILIPTLLLILTIILYFCSRMGVKKTTTIQITPPENLNPLELAYIYHKKVSASDVISLIPYLVDQKYIKMEFPPNQNMSRECNFRIIKRREYDDNNTIEGYLLSQLFKKSDVVTYYDLCNDLEYKALFAFCTDVVNSKRNYFLIFSKLFSYIKKVLTIAILIGLFMFDLLFNANYMYLYIIQVFLLIAISASMNGSDVGISIKKGPIKLTKNNVMITTLIVFVLLVFSSIFLVAESTETYTIFKTLSESFLYLGGILIFVMIYLIRTHIKKRNAYGESLYQQILQFKDFLSLTPRESIEAEFNYNKDCYFDIFSYCFVLDLSNKCVSEYDKFFNHVCHILYEASDIHKTHMNGLEMQHYLEKYQGFMEIQQHEFQKYISVYPTVFLGSSISSDDFTLSDNLSTLSQQNLLTYILKALKDWILNN